MIQNAKGAKCSFCGAEAFLKHRIEKFEKPFEVWECVSCGLIFRHPLPSSAELKAIYDESYYTGGKEFVYEDERKTFSFHVLVWEARLKKLEKFLKTGSRRILDVGCSFGGLLRTAEKRGWKGYGLEISDFSRSYAESFLPGRVFKDWGETSFEENFFDAVTMVEVIEHLDDPISSLKEIYRVLKPGGILLIQTADMAGKQAKKAGKNYHYFLPGHLFYFSASILRLKLQELGFSRVKIFRPVEFGLLPKLRKSRGQFSNLLNYLKWFRIVFYHFKGYLHWKDRALTSSMVVYAWKSS